MPAPVPIVIIGGFLGSGKTSLLTHVLMTDHGRRIAVLINDFGEINIDAQLVVAIEGQHTVSLANGCICCTIRDDLLTEVARLLAMPDPPEQIIIETSGVSDPETVAQTFLLDSQQQRVRVEAIISVFDADQSAIPADYQALARSQIEVADIVVLNKIDLVSADQVAECRRSIQSIAPKARVLETTHGRVPVGILFDGATPETEHEPHGRPPHHHGGDFATWTYRTDRPFSFDAMHRAIERLPIDIYRAKGRVKLEIDPGERAILQVTGRRGWLRLDGPWSPGEIPATELVLIGRPGSLTRERIAEHFQQALESASKRQDGGYVVEDLLAFTVVFA